jgi:hypothetical protein
MITENDGKLDIYEFVTSSKPYDAYVYYTGYLAKDREDKSKPELMKYAQQVGRAAMEMSDKGKICLVQRKLRFMQYEYIAIKRKPPQPFPRQKI